MPKSHAFNRRAFLRNAGKITVGAGIGPAVPNIFLNRTKAASGENPNEFIRIGVIGVGSLGNIATRTGKKIVWDPAKQEIIGDAELAGWICCPYRAPWKLPVA